MTKPLIDHVAIVTGGSRGIGKRIAIQLVEHGAHVVITGRDRAKLEEAARYHARIVPVAADMQCTEDLVHVVNEAQQRWGRIDLLVNNAGQFGLSPIDELQAAFFEEMLRVNVVGPAQLIRLCLPELEKSSGAIVNVTSVMAHKASPGIVAYAASKAALEQLTRNLALELGPRGIRVNAIAPGPTDTGILARSGFSEAMIKQSNQDLLKQMPLQRLGQADEVAEWVVRLADPAAAWVTGQVLSVDGGLAVS